MRPTSDRVFLSLLTVALQITSTPADTIMTVIAAVASGASALLLLIVAVVIIVWSVPMIPCGQGS